MLFMQNARKARRSPARRPTQDELDVLRQLADPELIRLCLLQDEAAWCEFTRRFDALLRKRISNRRGVRTVLDSDAADDVIGDLYVRILGNDMAKLRQWHASPARGSLIGLLSTIAGGIAVDHIRHKLTGVESAVGLGDWQRERDKDPNRGADWFAIEERNMRDPIKKRRKRLSKDDDFLKNQKR